MQVGLVAEFKVRPEKLPTFLAAARDELTAVRENEPGCLRFDVIVFDEEEGSGAFVEVFADQDAADKHRETPHFSVFFDAIKDIEVEWTARGGETITRRMSCYG